VTILGIAENHAVFHEVTKTCGPQPVLVSRWHVAPELVNDDKQDEVRPDHLRLQGGNAQRCSHEKHRDSAAEKVFHLRSSWVIAGWATATGICRNLTQGDPHWFAPDQ
jgi:hypothetical protein